MISITAERDSKNRVRGFTARNHGAGHVCAAVSLLVINTVNGIERFTADAVSCEYEEDGGYIGFSLTEAPSRDAALLLDVMMFGLTGVRDKYPGEIKITENLYKDVNV
jgi:hypothetical protein